MDQTTQLSFSIFKKLEDNLSWHKHKEFASLTSNISEEKRIQLISAIEFLEVELGKSFLKKIERNHPILNKLTNKCPWQYDDLINFANTLTKLKSIDSNYQKLLLKINGLSSSNSEAIPFLEVADSFLNMGCHIKFLEEEQNKRTPDIEIISPEGEIFYAEISEITDSEKNKGAKDNFRIISNHLHFNCANFIHWGTQFKYIPDDVMPNILGEITKANQEAAGHPNNIISVKNEYIELKFENSEKESQLKKWVNENNLRLGFQSPVNYNETPRIVKNNKIKEKARQIPADSSGIIYFPTQPHYFFQINLEETIRSFNNKMKDFPNLIGIVVYSKFLDPRESVNERIGNHLFGIKMLNEVLARNFLFIKNENFNHQISSKTMDIIYQSFI